MSCVTVKESLRYNLKNQAFEGQPLVVEDLAWSLSRIQRFMGHGERPISVALHSVCVANALIVVHDEKLDRIRRLFQKKYPDDPALVEMHGLLHDAHEMIIGDVPAPLKRTLSDDTLADIRRHESGAQRAICDALGVRDCPPDLAHFVEKADRAAAAVEFREKFASHRTAEDVFTAEFLRPLENFQEMQSYVQACTNFYTHPRRQWFDDGFQEFTAAFESLRAPAAR